MASFIKHIFCICNKKSKRTCDIVSDSVNIIYLEPTYCILSKLFRLILAYFLSEYFVPAFALSSPWIYMEQWKLPWLIVNGDVLATVPDKLLLYMRNIQIKKVSNWKSYGPIHNHSMVDEVVSHHLIWWERTIDLETSLIFL